MLVTVQVTASFSNIAFHLQNWAKLCALLWSATSHQLHSNFHSSFTWKKKWLVAAQNLQSIKTLSVLTLELSQYRKSGSMVSSREQVAACSDCSWLGNTVFVLACASRAEELPQDSGQELGCWFCQLNLWLPSGTALGEIARWQVRAQTWTQLVET